jgi:hypothetical protein
LNIRAECTSEERERERKTDRPHTRPQLEDIGLKSAKESEKSEFRED